MAHTEICPVCEGAGLVNRERLEGSVVEMNIQCYGCLGKGWVVAPGPGPKPPRIVNALSSTQVKKLITQPRALKGRGRTTK
ncbi:MAG: hypothetical protein OEZ32_08350 [Nitrospinota bacterium]|nr:hypothetical protein [Nitrospinota bacterium]